MFTPAHWWLEAFVIIIRELLTNLSAALAGIAVIATLMLVHPLAVAIVVLSILLTDLLLLGTMWVAGIALSQISIINLVVAVGLALGYTMHVMHAFLTLPGDSRTERVHGALLRVAPAVAAAALSTLGGVVVLAGAKSAIMRIFFKILLSTVLISSIMGLVMVPALLVFVGPAACLQAHEDDCGGTSLVEPEHECNSDMPQV